MPNLEEDLIETAEEGYLQIKQGYPWQIVQPPGEYFPDGSILWRIFRGWNQRRDVVGLPLLAYKDTAFTEVETIEDAKIHKGAILQNAAFWRALQNETFIPAVQDTGCVIGIGGIEEAGQFRTIRETYAENSSVIDGHFDVAIQPMTKGDIISAETINAICRRFAVYNTAHLRVGSVNITDYGYNFIPAQGTVSDKQTPLWLGTTSNLLGSATYSMDQTYKFPVYFLGIPAEYVWRNAGGGEQFGTTQPSVVYAYDGSRPATVNGVYNSFDIFTSDPASWPPYHFTTTNQFDTSQYTSATTLNMIMAPPFTDLPATIE
jgi:hypothetical protein